MQTKSDFEILSKFKREPCSVKLSKQTGRDNAPVTFHADLCASSKQTIDNRDYSNKKYSLVHERTPGMVDYSTATDREYHEKLQSKSLNICQTEINPNLDVTSNKYNKLGNVKIDMKRQAGRDNDFFYNQFDRTINKKHFNVTSNIDYLPPQSTMVADPKRQKWDNTVSIPSVDIKKFSGRKTPSKPISNDLDYNPRYDQVRPNREILNKGSNAVMFKKQSNRKIGFMYNWLALLHTHRSDRKEPPQGYDIKYDCVEVGTKGTPNIGKTTGRDPKKPGSAYYLISKNTHDLSYNPSYKQVSGRTASFDVFLCTGRNDDVKSLTQSVDNLIANVDMELRKMKSSGSKSSSMKRLSSSPSSKFASTGKLHSTGSMSPRGLNHTNKGSTKSTSRKQSKVKIRNNNAEEDNVDGYESSEEDHRTHHRQKTQRKRTSEMDDEDDDDDDDDLDEI